MADGGVKRESGDGASDRIEDEPPRIPHPAAGLEIAPSRSRDGKAVVSLPPERFFEVSPQTALLLGLVDGRRDLATLAAMLSERTSPPIDAAALRGLIEGSLAPKGLVHWGEAPPEAERPRSPMWLRVPLAREGAVNAGAAALTPLFRPAAVAIAGTLALAAHAWFFLSGPRLDLGRELFRFGEWLPPLALYYLSVLAHEFGHAAALRHHGQRAGEMGIGVYRIFIVFFTDVSRAWRLPRLARAVVDAGGMYVQVLFASVLIAFYAWTHAAAPARAVLLVDLSLIANLNPFLRMDGYWLVSDLTETRDLRGRSLAWTRALLGRRGSGVRPASRVLAIYTLLSLAYFAALALWLLLRVVPRLARQMAGAWHAARGAGAPGGTIAPALFLAGSAVAMVAIALFAWTGARTIAGSGRRRSADARARTEPPAG